MKRVLLCVISAMAVIAAVPFTSGAAEGPKFQKTNGTGTSGTYGQVHVNADNNEHGGDLGHFFIAPPNMPRVQGDVTCLRVDGNTALVGGTQRETGMPFLIEVTDNGEPGAGEDTHRYRPASPNEVASCSDFGNNPPPEPIERGNYIVQGG